MAWREGLFGWLARNRPPRPALLALGLWILITMGTTVLVAPDQLNAIRWTLHWIVHLAFGFSIAFLCTRELRVRDFVNFYMAGFLLYALLIVAFIACYWDSPVDWRRDLPAATNIRHIAIYACSITAMSIGSISSAPSRGARPIGIGIATLGFFIGLWTGSRGMIVSVWAALTVGTVAVPALRQPRLWADAAVSLILATVAASLLAVPNDRTMGLARMVGATIRNDLTNGRLQLWAGAVRAITQRPVFGYGPGQLAQLVRLDDVGQSHNLVLEILLSWGTAGLACVAAAGFFYLRAALPAVRQDHVRLTAPLMGMISLLLLSMVDGAMFHVLPVSTFAACAGMIASRFCRCASNISSSRDAPNGAIAR